jgi:hypothetical protein
MPWCGVLIATLAAWGCGDASEEPVVEHMLYGSMTCTSQSASGHRGHLKLVSMGDPREAAALYSADDCLFAGPSCDYQLSFVAEGDYTVYAFIDLDDDASVDEPMPSPGDRVALGRPLYLMAKQQMDFPDSAFKPLP